MLSQSLHSLASCGRTYFDFTGVQLTWMLVGYGFVAAVLPVWLLLAPRYNLKERLVLD